MIRCENVLYPDNFTDWWKNEIQKIKSIDLNSINENCLQNIFSVTRNKGSNLLNSTKVFLANFDKLETFNAHDSKLKLLQTSNKYTSFNIEDIINGNWDHSSFQGLKEPKMGLKANRENVKNCEKELALIECYLSNDDKKFAKILNGDDDIDHHSKNRALNNLIMNYLNQPISIQKISEIQLAEHLSVVEILIKKKIEKLNHDYKLLNSMMHKRQLYVIVWNYYQVNRDGLMKMFIKKMFNTGYVFESAENTITNLCF
jgi:predicted XRE-type DNA-binding protein